MIVWRDPCLDEHEWASPLAMIGDWRDPSDINDGDPKDPLPDRLRQLTEKAITQGKAQQAIDAVTPIVHPPENAAQRGARNLGRQF